VKRMQGETYFKPMNDKPAFKELVSKMSTAKTKVDLTQ